MAASTFGASVCAQNSHVLDRYSIADPPPPKQAPELPNFWGRRGWLQVLRAVRSGSAPNCPCPASPPPLKRRPCLGGVRLSLQDGSHGPDLSWRNTEESGKMLPSFEVSWSIDLAAPYCLPKPQSK
jgi:hypothetical protein